MERTRKFELLSGQFYNGKQIELFPPLSYYFFADELYTLLVSLILHWLNKIDDIAKIKIY